MNLLLDTHVAIWAAYDHKLLSARAREMISDAANDVSVSAASIWEIAIKHAIKPRGPRGMPISASEAIILFERAGFVFLPVSQVHARAVEDLEFHHRDPFDRLLIAQALSEPLRLLTHDTQLQRYSDTVIVV